jgi:hypothetical protein
MKRLATLVIGGMILAAGLVAPALAGASSAPLSAKVMAALRANNTVQRVTLELHFVAANGQQKVVAVPAQGFNLGEADKFCANDLTKSSLGIARDLEFTDKAFAAMTYVSANCALDKSGRIRMSAQTYPIEVK